MEENKLQPHKKYDDFPPDIDELRHKLLDVSDQRVGAQKVTDALDEKLRGLNKSAENPMRKQAELFISAKELMQLPEDYFVIHAGCGSDGNVGEVFGKEHVLGLDISLEAVESYKNNGLNAIQASSETYVSEKPIDVLVFWNPGPTTKHLVDQVRRGGYVLANNWLDSANVLHEFEELELIGGIADRVYEPAEMERWFIPDYIHVDRDGKIHRLSKEEAVQAESEGKSVIEQAQGVDCMFIFRKK